VSLIPSVSPSPGARLLPQLVIARKRDGAELTRDEIAAFVRGATDGSWPDYQLSALLMAICLRGMTAEETALLTDAMLHSGAIAELGSVRLPKVDKHSTGGVGDKISLHLAPMVAACGAAVPMISGRGLGHTGGTLDKLESIPGFRVGLSLAGFRGQLERIGLALIGQTPEVAPADRKLYALRDVTGTVESIPLICASILSKKLAEGIDALVLDVKFGRGAFMPNRDRARDLALALTTVARNLGKPTRAILTAMDEPLGHTVGNALEVAESIACLRGEGPADVMAVTYALGEQMLLLAGVAPDAAAARAQLEGSLETGAALDKFRRVVEAQGGDARVVDDPRRLPRARLQLPLPSPADGWVREVDPRAVALAALRLGAGRTRTDEAIDPAVGIAGLVKVGARVSRGEPLAVIHASDEARATAALAEVAAAIAVGDQPATALPLIGEMIG
jgi:pyrimidine-nucleoside phosphorylase